MRPACCAPSVAYNLDTPAAITTTLTGEGTSLIPAAGYTVSFGYTLTGYSTGENEPAIDGLPSENITNGYDAFGEPTSLASNIDTYVLAVGYPNTANHCNTPCPPPAVTCG